MTPDQWWLSDSGARKWRLQLDFVCSQRVTIQLPLQNIEVFMQRAFNRITLIVLDGAGIGAMPDAPEWGDAGSDTFGHILESRTVRLPNLQSIGLGNIRPLEGVPPAASPRGSFGRCALRSNGKDTTTGHWEMAGIILDQAFPTYPHGFPAAIIDRFIREAGGPGILGNISASGTEIIKELGSEPLQTGKPIVYTSAD